MAANPALGVFFHWLGGLASGSFYVPYRGVRRWSWETYWLVGGFFSWIIAPWFLGHLMTRDRKSTRLNSSHSQISYAVFCLKKKNEYIFTTTSKIHLLQ